MTFHTPRLARAAALTLCAATAAALLVPSARAEAKRIDMDKYVPPAGTIERAAYDGNVSALKALLKKQPKKVSAADPPTYFTPLHFAALRGKMDAAKYLISKGANVNAMHKNFGAPLNIAASKGNLPMVKLLVEHRANLESRTAYRETSLVQAAAFPSLPVVQYLISKGANIKATDENGMQSLHWAALGGNTAEIAYLMDHSADIESYDANGRTAFGAAVSGKEWNAAELLLKRGANIDYTNPNAAMTQLAVAVMMNDLETAEFLAKHGADTTAPLESAKSAGNEKMVSLLEKYPKK